MSENWRKLDCYSIVNSLTDDAYAFLKESGIAVSHLMPKALHLAGSLWRKQCEKPDKLVCPTCGGLLPRRFRIIPDFLIGAQALVQSDGLLTRERGFYSKNFPGLNILE
jgi:hypothetical protein